METVARDRGLINQKTRRGRKHTHTHTRNVNLDDRGGSYNKPYFPRNEYIRFSFPIRRYLSFARRVASRPAKIVLVILCFLRRFTCVATCHLLNPLLRFFVRHADR